MVHDPMVALETLASLGFERVLTSGCDSSALEGLPLIKRLIDQVCINYMHANKLPIHGLLSMLLSYCSRAACVSVFLSFLYPNFHLFCHFRLKAELPSCQVSTFPFVCSLHVFLYYLFINHFCNTGGGITERNLQRILEGSGAQEFHCSARSSRDSAMKFRFVSSNSASVNLAWDVGL